MWDVHILTFCILKVGHPIYIYYLVQVQELYLTNPFKVCMVSMPTSFLSCLLEKTIIIQSLGTPFVYTLLSWILF